jgi:hypothetical protein
MIGATCADPEIPSAAMGAIKENYLSRRSAIAVIGTNRF